MCCDGPLLSSVLQQTSSIMALLVHLNMPLFGLSGCNISQIMKLFKIPQAHLVTIFPWKFSLAWWSDHLDCQKRGPNACKRIKTSEATIYKNEDASLFLDQVLTCCASYPTSTPPPPRPPRLVQDNMLPVWRSRGNWAPPSSDSSSKSRSRFRQIPRRSFILKSNK